MKKIFTVLLFTSITTVAWSQADNFKITEIFPIEASHSYMGFSIKYMGYASFRGRFPVFQGAIRYVENDLTKTSVSLFVDVSSLDTDNDWRDKDLKSDNWFGVEAFTRIVFVSQKSEATPQGMIVTGELTMHGVTKTVVINMAKPSGIIKDIRGDSQVVFSGGLTLNRKDYGVEGKNWSAVKEGMTAVADEVVIEVTILGKQINEKNFKNWVSDAASPQGKIYNMAKTEGAEKAIKLFESLQAEAGSTVKEDALNIAGHMLIKEGNVNDALILFRKNTEAFPQAAIAYSSYGYALASSGKWADARKNYLIAQEKDPGNMSTKEILRHLGN